jgi:hypothetical protein
LNLTLTPSRFCHDYFGDRVSLFAQVGCDTPIYTFHSS